MNSFELYKRIQFFKASGTALRNGVNFAHVVATFLYDQSYYYIFKKIIFSFLFETNIKEYELSGSKIILYYSQGHKNRADYDYIPARLREILGDQCDYVESSERISLTQWLRTLKELPCAWSLTNGYAASFFERLSCSCLIAKYQYAAKKIFPPILVGRDKLITFCDAHSTENLMAQIANSTRIKTYTCQHGQYRILDSSIMSADAEAYANFVSNYMLCWGTATRDEFVRIGFKSEQFIIVGWIKEWSLAKPGVGKGVFGVMLNGENADKSNFHLLQLARKLSESLNLNYLVRLHPWSKPEKYKEYLSGRCVAIGHYDFASYIESVDFSISHMTGAAMELLHFNAPVYLWDDGKLPQVFRVRGLSFDDAEYMSHMIQKDIQCPELAADRFREIGGRFNDDSDQSMRISIALTNEAEPYA